MDWRGAAFAWIASNVGAAVVGLFVGLLVRPTKALWHRISYRGPNISGVYQTRINFPETGNFNDFQIKLEHKGHSVSACADCTNGYNQGKTFHFTGEFHPPIMIGTYKINDPTNHERGTCTMRYTKGGKSLEGYVAFMDDEKDTILAAPFSMVRVSELHP